MEVCKWYVNVCELCGLSILSDVAARKIAQKYMAVNLSIVTNIAYVKDAIINKKTLGGMQNIGFYEKTENC